MFGSDLGKRYADEQTTFRRTFSAPSNSSNSTKGIPSRVQYSARSFSAFAPYFCFTNSRSACRAAERSVVNVSRQLSNRPPK